MGLDFGYNLPEKKIILQFLERESLGNKTDPMELKEYLDSEVETASKDPMIPETTFTKVNIGTFQKIQTTNLYYTAVALLG